MHCMKVKFARSADETVKGNFCGFDFHLGSRKRICELQASLQTQLCFRVTKKPKKASAHSG